MGHANGTLLPHGGRATAAAKSFTMANNEHEDRTASDATPTGRQGERPIPGKWLVWGLMALARLLSAGLLALYLPEFIEAAAGFP
jgi:hypothetical protein